MLFAGYLVSIHQMSLTGRWRRGWRATSWAPGSPGAWAEAADGCCWSATGTCTSRPSGWTSRSLVRAPGRSDRADRAMPADHPDLHLAAGRRSPACPSGASRSAPPSAACRGCWHSRCWASRSAPSGTSGTSPSSTSTTRRRPIIAAILLLLRGRRDPCTHEAGLAGEARLVRSAQTHANESRLRPRLTHSRPPSRTALVIVYGLLALLELRRMDDPRRAARHGGGRRGVDPEQLLKLVAERPRPACTSSRAESLLPRGARHGAGRPGGRRTGRDSRNRAGGRSMRARGRSRPARVREPLAERPARRGAGRRLRIRLFPAWSCCRCAQRPGMKPFEGRRQPNPSVRFSHGARNDERPRRRANSQAARADRVRFEEDARLRGRCLLGGRRRSTGSRPRPPGTGAGHGPTRRHSAAGRVQCPAPTCWW